VNISGEQQQESCLFCLFPEDHRVVGEAVGLHSQTC